jgi:hypothetical protein
MVIPHHKFGQTSIAKARNSQELRQVLNDTWLESEHIIIKPNWATTELGYFADAETLRMLFEALDSKITITESHIFTRSQNYPVKGMNLNVGEKELSLESFLFGEGWKWLIKNPDWDWFKDGEYWDWMRKEEKDFLDDFGFTDLFKEFNVGYVNVTDEVWSGRIAERARILVFFGMHSKKLIDSNWRNYVINWQSPNERQLSKREQNNMGELLDSINVFS